MKKNLIILESKVLHYKIPIYNFFQKKLKNNYIIEVVTTNKEYDSNNLNIYKMNHWKIMWYIFKKKNLEIIICRFGLKNISLFPLILLAKLKGIKFIWWNHGIDLQDKNNLVKNLFYGFIHRLADAILLYSSNEIQFVKTKIEKIFVANNTLNFDDFPDIRESKESLRKKYNIREEKVVLFVGRIQKRKRLMDLLNIVDNDMKNIALIIVGPGITKSQLEIVNRNRHIYYLGPIYDTKKVNEIFKMSDIFSIPGHIGLGLNHAFYWGLPVITEDVPHAPEIVYLRHGENGFVVPKDDVEQLKEKIIFLFKNKKVLRRFSENAKRKIRENGSMDKMFEGFIGAIDFVEGLK